MKNKTIPLKSKKMVLQVFHNYVQYNKDEKSFEDRKERTKWRDEIKSESGYIKNGKLFLSEGSYNPNLAKSDLIILNDFNADSLEDVVQKYPHNYGQNLIQLEKRSENKTWAKINQVQCFNLIGYQRPFQIFQLMMKRGKISVHLNYSHDKVGEPKRSNFKLFDLDVNVPIEFKINGKQDSYRGRRFIERNYIFHLLGEIAQIELITKPVKSISKKIPEPDKVVDLMKELY